MLKHGTYLESAKFNLCDNITLENNIKFVSEQMQICRKRIFLVLDKQMTMRPHIVSNGWWFRNVVNKKLFFPAKVAKYQKYLLESPFY